MTRDLLRAVAEHQLRQATRFARPEDPSAIDVVSTPAASLRKLFARHNRDANRAPGLLASTDPEVQRMSQVKEVTRMTETQLKALDLLNDGYEADESVQVAPQTRHRVDGTRTINRQVAGALVRDGFARFSEPHGRFLLITGAGRALAKR